jgi:RNA polymerase sigma factor, sigma-70 family
MPQQQTRQTDDASAPLVSKAIFASQGIEYGEDCGGRVGESPERRFERLVLPWRDALRARARHLTGNPADAEDLVQETLLRAYLRLSLLNSEETVKGWLFTILKRLFLNGFRARGDARRPRTVPPLSLDSDLYGETLTLAPERHPAWEPAQTLERRMQHAAALCALGALPERYRAPVMLFDIEQLTYEEVAERLGIPIGTVRSRISRGRARLQRSLYAWQ